MQRSTSHILTTHTGSLPRSLALQDLLRLREERQPYDQGGMEAGIRTGVEEIVQRQISIGLDVINDGEQGRSQYAAYVKERLTGFEGEQIVRARPRLGESDFPNYAGTHQSSTNLPQPACNGPIAWKNLTRYSRILHC
jgi:5-methyltetrahydropteroyltriglutamate--homocysteine methyltransferase